MKRLQSLSLQLRGILTVSLLRALSSAILSPVIALFLKKYLETDQAVSWLITFSYVIGILSSVYGSVIISYLQKRKAMILTLLLFSLIIGVLAFSQGSNTVIFFFSIYTFLMMLLQFNISLYIDHFSSQRNMGTHFGTNGVLTNIGWVAGPMLGGLLAQSFSFIEVFLIASLFSFIALLVFIFSEPPDKHKEQHHHVHIFRNIKEFFSSSFLRQLYVNGLGVNLYYGTYMLIPLLLQERGASISEIGLYTGLASIPWVLLEYPAGKWADRTKKEKRLFIVGYLMLSVALFSIGFGGSSFVTFLLLLLTTIATALTENNILSYFYRYVPQENIGLPSVFLTHTSLGLFIGSLLASLSLTIMPLEVFFSFLGILTLAFVANALRLKPDREPV